jgi:hypothetical protein
MKVKRKELFSAIILSIVIIVPTLYTSIVNEEYFFGRSHGPSMLQSDGAGYYSQGNQQNQENLPVILETIEGELNRGTFEDTINKLETLVYEKEGYIKSLRMTFQKEFWSGYIICKVPPTRVTSFTFGARAIIDANGTVTYINISVDYIDASQQGQLDTNATISINLKEAQPANAAGIAAALSPVWSILVTSLSWIAQGLIVAVPLCFASLGVVIVVNRGIIPIWKNTLRKSKAKV